MFVENGIVGADEAPGVHQGEILFVPYAAGVIAVPGDSGKVVYQRLCAPAYPVEKSGFADVRPSDYRYYCHWAPPLFV